MLERPSNIFERIQKCYIMFKPSQHLTFNMVYNMLCDMFERFAWVFRNTDI